LFISCVRRFLIFLCDSCLMQWKGFVRRGRARGCWVSPWYGGVRFFQMLMGALICFSEKREVRK
jgi:hypothetical protein